MMPKTLLLAGVLTLCACGANYIVNTEVEDTPKNRVIADLVDRYRIAVERRDVDGLMELVSRRYFSNAGTTSDSTDDYGYEQMEERVFPLLRNEIKSVQFSIFLRKVDFQGEDRAIAEMEYTYKFSYIEEGKERWFAKNDFSRLEFTREDGVWRIIGGL